MYQTIRINFNPNKNKEKNRLNNKSSNDDDSNEYYCQTPANHTNSSNDNSIFSPIKYSNNLEPESMINNSNTLTFTPRTNDKTVPNCKFPGKLGKEDRTPKALLQSLNSKPCLTSVESKKFLNEYKYSKKYQEDTDDDDDNNSQGSNDAHHYNHYISATHPKESLATDKRSDYEKLLDNQIANLPIPLDKADNEKFKLLAMQKMKKVALPFYKSAKKESEIKPSYQETFNSSMEYPIMKKKKLINSAKKDFTLALSLYSKKKEYKFPLFIDKQIGIYEYWQEHMIKSNADEDIPTDNEQLYLAKSYTLAELKEAFIFFKEKGKEAINNIKYTLS